MINLQLWVLLKIHSCPKLGMSPSFKINVYAVTMYTAAGCLVVRENNLSLDGVQTNF